MVKKIKPDGSKTIYVGGVYSIPFGDEIDKSSGGSVTHTRMYYPAGGAMRIDGTLYYIFKNHLGSASVVTDASGNTVGEDRFYPFGETRFTTGTIYTEKLFTRQQEMAGLGIYNYLARFYSKLGRFYTGKNHIAPIEGIEARRNIGGCVFQVCKTHIDSVAQMFCLCYKPHNGC